jgi:hypothetical protein
MEGRAAEVEAWLGRLSPRQREQAEWLAGMVHASGAGIAEAVKWRRLTFTVEGDWHHWLCAVAVTGRGVRLVLHKGSLLEDPAGMLQGEGRYLREIPHDRAARDPAAVAALLRQALARRTDMLDEGA